LTFFTIALPDTSASLLSLIQAALGSNPPKTLRSVALRPNGSVSGNWAFGGAATDSSPSIPGIYSSENYAGVEFAADQNLLNAIQVIGSGNLDCYLLF
jgi:hypothetical protein